MSAPEAFVDTPVVPGTPIQPATITDTKSVNSFQVYVVALELFKSVTVSVSLYDAAGAAVGSRSFVFADAEYMAWNNDDQYLVNLVAQKLGFTLA